MRTIYILQLGFEYYYSLRDMIIITIIVIIIIIIRAIRPETVVDLITTTIRQ